MAHAIRIGNGEELLLKSGFTLVEMLLVLFLVALLASLVTPVATRSVDQAKDSTLKEDLRILRKAIDEYYANTGQYPQSISQLVEKKYIRRIPIDPITESTTSWVEAHADDPKGGINDVHSGADGMASNGKLYRDW